MRAAATPATSPPAPAPIEYGRKRSSDNAEFYRQQSIHARDIFSTLDIHNKTFNYFAQRRTMCPNCDAISQGNSFRLGVGLASQVEFQCPDCGFRDGSLDNAPDVRPWCIQGGIVECSEASVRLVAAMKRIGVSDQQILRFAELMELQLSESTLQAARAVVSEAASQVAERCMAEAAAQTLPIPSTNNVKEVAVQLDCSWSKRFGWSAHYGAMPVIDLAFGRVIDFVALSRRCVCPAPSPDVAHHQANKVEACQANYVGSAKGMEVSIFCVGGREGGRESV